MSCLLYLWRHSCGRLALAAVLVGVLGLTLHFWTGLPLLAALDLNGVRRAHRKGNCG